MSDDDPNKKEEEGMPEVYTNRSVTVKLLINFSFILIIGVAMIYYLRSSFDDIFDKALQPMDYSYQYTLNCLDEVASDTLTKEDLKVLVARVEMLHARKKENENLIRTFGKTQHALLSLFPILSIITALLGFYVAQKGWSATGNHARWYFLLFTALTTLVGIFPNVYNMKDAMSNNIKSYHDLTTLENKIFHYVFTAPDLYEDTVNSTRSLIDIINKAELDIPQVEFTINKVDPGSFLNDINNPKGR